MTMHRTPDALDRWLAAEQAGLENEAESALLEMFEALPPLEPPAGFADRVMARAQLAAAPAVVRRVAVPRWARVSLVFGLLAAGSSVLWLPAVWAAASVLVDVFSLAEVLGLGTRALSGAGQALASAIGLWRALATVVEALAPPIATPRVAVALAACLAVSAVSFRFLRDLLLRERSWAYVDPI